jgi:hypothetical protein
MIKEYKKRSRSLKLKYFQLKKNQTDLISTLIIVTIQLIMNPHKKNNDMSLDTYVLFHIHLLLRVYLLLKCLKKHIIFIRQLQKKNFNIHN